MSEAKRPLNEEEQRVYMEVWVKVRAQFGPDEAEEGREQATQAAEAKIAEMQAKREGKK